MTVSKVSVRLDPAVAERAHQDVAEGKGQVCERLVERRRTARTTGRISPWSWVSCSTTRAVH